MNLTFKHLEIFNAVVVAGSISKATRVTGLSQPTISQQLAKFEEELGAQLIYRRRSGAVELTPAGDFWHRAADDILKRRDEALSQYKALFRNDQMVPRFGTTPSLRGGFAEAAARIAVEQGRFSRFEFIWGSDSDEIVEKIDTHRINCGIVSATSVEHNRHSMHVVPLFRDRIVLVTPRSVPASALAAALAGRSMNDTAYDALSRWVEVDAAVAWHRKSADWYRANLPEAQPYFSAVTHQVSVDFVAAGLATCHCPGSLLPNLSEQVRKRVAFYDLRDFGREAVLVMPKHLQSLKPFADFAASLADYVRSTYADVGMSNPILPLPEATLARIA